MYRNFKFNIISSFEKARVGVLKTPHGDIQTPAFIFCGTKASVKGISPKQLIENETQVILSNTYHLLLYPGADHIRERGGLHSFIGWKGPILTDSGGFQIFSLGHGSVADEIKGRRSGISALLKIDEDGALFRSYRDGALQFLTPEKSIDTQRNIGANLIVAFDECTPYHSDKKYTENSMERSHRWEKRSLNEFIRKNDFSQALYGVIQGGVYEDLRKRSAEFISENPFFATAIGGTLGSTKTQMYEVVEMAMNGLDISRPIHLLGIGGISDIFRGVEIGIDTFDCVHPTRIARHGAALVKKNGTREHINLKNTMYAQDDNPIENDCNCSTCKGFSRAYLHYLLKANELLAFPAITIHNIKFMNKLMGEIREGIQNKTLDIVREKWC
ncbi:MAG: tRNA guanosine(34) transglycosylase Tgt [Holosporaceae bacterium]|jgi:queuine tRNA-ribosyltransferase|nr:tRNA guanosine(34) transglycosylase Tgt [Holosporaceae bacterium]